MDLSKRTSSPRFNRLFMNKGLQGMLNEKGYRILEMVFLFVASHFDRLTGLTEEGPKTKLHTFYLDLIDF